jgi:beta-lactamase superfamily II metal-dependent hydrolase
MSTYPPPPPMPPPLLGYEVDFLPVGDASKSGDAIALRYGNLFGGVEDQQVVVIDGGYEADGKALAKHIRQYYHTKTVDLVVSTHPDQDHAAGLAVVLEEMDVRLLWLHKPWEHTDGIERAFKSARVTDRSVEAALKKSLDDARELEYIAARKGIPIVEPYTWTTNANGILTVLGPSRAFYDAMLPDFRGTLAPKVSLADALAKLYVGPAGVVVRKLEDWGVETLRDDGKTSPENNTSTIILANFPNGHRWLFTGDAGIPALTQVADLMDQYPIGSAGCGYIQIPHHGSRRNVGPTILDRLVGPKIPNDAPYKKAYVSAAKDGAPKHPSRRVTNAFKRRGARVYETAGNYLWLYKNAPDRHWGPAEEVQFYPDVGEDEDD